MGTQANGNGERKGGRVGNRSGRVFTCFPKLPPELRNRIWKEHCGDYEPRIIDLWLKESSTKDNLIYCTHSRAPALLHTSREARSVGLQHYDLFQDDDDEAPAGPRIYVRWDSDIIFPVPFDYEEPHGNNDPDDNMDLEMALMVDLGDCENCQKIKRVAIPESHTNWTVFFSDANNISEILVYVPIDGSTYKRLDRVEESYADGIRFNIELTEFRSQGRMTADNEEQEMIKTLDYAVEDVQKNMELDPDVSWDDHSVQPIIRKMSLKLLELRQ